MSSIGIAVAELPRKAKPSPRRPVLATSDDAENRGCKITVLAQFVHPTPPLPRSSGGRRLDVFQAYQVRVTEYCQKAPIQAYTVEVPDLDLGYKNLVVTGGIGDLRLMDLFRYGQQSDDLQCDPVLELCGRSLVIAEGCAGNYYHFLFNSLVRLAVVMQTHPQVRFDHVVVTDDEPSFVKQAMEMLGIPREKIVSLARTPRVRCERAWVGQYLSDLVYPHQLAVQLLQRLFPAVLNSGRRLLIVRKGIRAVTNLGEVIEVLKPRKFEPISCEKMSLSEQASLFASAEAVIAPHGAGLSNLVFCPARTRVIEIMSPRYVETIFWFLSTSCNHDYSFLLGRGEDAPLMNKSDTGGWRSEKDTNIDVDPTSLRQLCEAAGL